MRRVSFKGLASGVLSPILTPSQDAASYAKEPIMATLTISLSDEEMRRLEVLGKCEGLTVEVTRSTPLPSV